MFHLFSKDAHEFLCQVLDQLKEDFDKLNKKSGLPEEITKLPDNSSDFKAGNCCINFC